MRVWKTGQLPLALLTSSLIAAATCRAVAADGRALAFDPAKGGCLACHQIPADPNAKSLATVGPALAGLKRRFANLNALVAFLRDPSIGNAGTAMPPYGRHRILSDDEINSIAEYLWKL